MDASERASLISELEQAGIKHISDNILRIAKKSDGSIVFLEQGNSRAGLRHILEGHLNDFINRGISENQIPDAIITAVIRGRIVGTQAAGRSIYEVIFNNQTQYISVTVGSNGYIVGANPTPERLIRRLTQRN